MKKSAADQQQLVASYDDIVGLDLGDPRRRRFTEQLLGLPQDKPVLPSGLSPFRTLPPAEPPRHLRTRMAAEIARAMSSSGCVTYDDLVAAGFTGEEITAHFTDARRAARVGLMVV